MSANKQWTKVGALCTSKPGAKSKYYIKVDSDVTLKKGQFLNVQDPRDNIKQGISAGRLTEEKGEALLAKIPEYIKFDLVLVTE